MALRRQVSSCTLCLKQSKVRGKAFRKKWNRRSNLQFICWCCLPPWMNYQKAWGCLLFAHHPCVGPKTTGNDLETFIGKIPLRKSNMAVARSSSFDQSNGTPAIADGNNGLVLQLVQWMTRPTDDWWSSCSTGTAKPWRSSFAKRRLGSQVLPLQWLLQQHWLTSPVPLRPTLVQEFWHIARWQQAIQVSPVAQCLLD